MKVKALVSFSGIITMALGEEKEIENEIIYADLLQAGYVVEVKKEIPKKFSIKKKLDIKKKAKTDEN